MKSISCCSVRLFIIQFWEVVTHIIVLLSAHLESISHYHLFMFVFSCLFSKIMKKEYFTSRDSLNRCQNGGILEPSRPSFIIAGRVENQYSPRASQRQTAEFCGLYSVNFCQLWISFKKRHLYYMKNPYPTFNQFVVFPR